MSIQSESFYVTTPIYYVNDKPHIGHAYTTILADVLARYHRLLGIPTFFLTGTDEHGQKVQKAAEANGVSPREQCDSTVVRFRALWEKLEITHDDFIRTTEPRHTKVVQAVLQDLYDRNLIYRDCYAGRYCVPCERFLTAKDADCPALCPECGRETEAITESNYFFRMSRYQEWLIAYIEQHPEFIQPSFRANETLGFLRQPLEDLCISRPKSRLAWGIELPFDPDYVCYVWFDALINYISGVGYRRDPEQFARWWPASYHLIGKDILTTHTVYWPTMLKAMDVPLPKTVFAHGWWLTPKASGTDSEAEKMSKSKGNVVNPMDMCDRYGVDAFRYFLLAEMPLGLDATFSEEAFILRYNSHLANDLGNLLSRVVKLTLKQFDGVLPVPGVETALETALRDEALRSVDAMEQALHEMRIDRGIEQTMRAVRAGNRYIEETAPWNLAKNGDMTRLGTVLYTVAELLRIVAGLFAPLMPAKMTELRRSIGMSDADAGTVSIEKLRRWGCLESGSRVRDIDSLFPRIQVEKVEPAPSRKKDGNTKKEKNNMETAEKLGETKPETMKSDSIPEGIVTVDDFFRTKLRTARVLEAERVEKADKLLKLRIDLGGESRQIVAGIAQHYAPEELVGKTIVVVANLKPAVIRGIESNGMLLAAKGPEGLRIVTVDGDVPSGVAVG